MMRACCFILASLCLHGVLCQQTGTISLNGGRFYDNGEAGIVQLFYNDTWYSICPHNFTDLHAGLVCRQLGYERGYALPLNAYGLDSLQMYKGEIVSCPGGENVQIIDCVFEDSQCSGPDNSYASVSCRNGTIDTSVTNGEVKLDTDKSSPQAGYLSAVLVYDYEVWGTVCSFLWTNENADVACIELGYSGGVAAYIHSYNYTTYPTMYVYECNGTETRLMDCFHYDFSCKMKTEVAGVFCYQNTAPVLSLVGGESHYGKLVLSVDGQQGLVCNADGLFDHQEASVACHQMGFTDGVVIQSQFDVGTITPMFLDGVSCDGYDTSLFQCAHSGWSVVSPDCDNTQVAVSVYCFENVRLIGAVIEPGPVLMGKVLVFKPEENQWHSICGEYFSQQAADVTCRQLGFPVAEILLPGSFGNVDTSAYRVLRTVCDGTEETLLQCTLDYAFGKCNTKTEDVALLCMRENAADGISFALSADYYGEIVATRHGVAGHVCREGWDDVDATVICNEVGFNHGIVLGTSQPYGRYQPVWTSKFDCVGTETRLADCSYTTALATDWACSADLVPAGALCFVNEPQDQIVRLNDGKTGTHHGRVEVYNDRTAWGTVCTTDWSNEDARVFCRQLGFADGQTQTGAFYGRADHLPVVLSGLKCEGSEASLFQCPNNGWNQVSTSCQTHNKDAGAFCYNHVRLEPGFQYGSVQYHSGEQYGLTCADGFDSNAAQVVCRQFNFIYSKPLCCSAMGPSDLDITLSDVKCTGAENHLRECDYVDTNINCPSGQYASVVCGDYDLGYTQMKANPFVMVTYFLEQGYVCSDGFTQQDATVVCAQKGFSNGMNFKASAQGLENKIRWLRGLQCKGTEMSISECGPHNWGQIQVCEWDSVAAVICSNNAEDMNFDIRLVNGVATTGRVEVKINGVWGSMCGLHLTKTEARVICRELGYHDGRAMSSGQYGAADNMILNGLSCDGTESSFSQCIWSGYGGNTAGCDLTDTATVTCFYNVQLAGSVFPYYGRLEMYDNTDEEWLAVCDRNFNINNAIIICRQLGYSTGIVQKGSPLGSTSSKLSIMEVRCNDTSECTFTKGVCGSNRYIAIYCSSTPITNENMEIRLPQSSFYGPVSVRRYGLWGHICSKGFTDTDAMVVCRQLGYEMGSAVQTDKTPGYPIIQGNVLCVGDESQFSECDRGYFIDGHGCYNINTVAGVICYDQPGLRFGSTAVNPITGLMSSHVTVMAGNQILYVSDVQFTDTVAAVYCKSLGYAGGEMFSPGTGSYGVSDVSCVGTEDSILQCPGTWDPEKTTDKSGPLAGVTCFTAVRLIGGDPSFYGVIFTSKGVNNGPVCSEGFDETDAGVACQSLNYDSGLVLCCSAFGTLLEEPVMTNVQCTGTESQFTDCNHDDVGQDQTSYCQKNYAAVACYSGSKPTDYTLHLPGTDSYTGHVTITYMGIDGSVCMDGWNDGAAHVTCKELGFRTGLAYNAERSVVGPYWTSNIQCQGTESRLADCQMTELGKVTECNNVLSHAGVICYNNDGMNYRLTGTGESRYGRVEVLMNGEWGSMCNTHWENTDGHVLCKMLGYLAGDAYHGAYNGTVTGPVWQSNFKCTGNEANLNECLSSGWKVTTSETCARHNNDAGVFCYKSVKLSTGVGRETEKGAVLFYKDEGWYKVCGDGFTDVSAAVVCQELGFKDGQAQTGDLYGALDQYPLLDTHKVNCTGEETDVTDCMKEDPCGNDKYASVVCYGFTLATTEVPGDQQGNKFDPVPVIVAVVVCVCIVIIVILVLYLVRRYRKNKKNEATKEQFDETIVSENVDGSFAVTNRLSTIMRTPEVPRVKYTPNGGNDEDSVAVSYANPEYVRQQDTEGPIAGVSRPQSSGSHVYNTVIDIGRSNKSNIYDNPVSRNTDMATSPYDNLKATNPHDYERVDNGTYNNASFTSLENERAIDKHTGDSTSDTQHEDTDGNYYRNVLADQQELSSPTQSVNQPTWPSHVE